MFASTTGGPVFAFVAICVAGIGFKAASSLFWPIPQAYLDPRIAAGVIALINSIGNLGGFFAPATFGYLEQKSGSIEGGLYALAVASLLAAGLVFLARRWIGPASGLDTMGAGSPFLHLFQSPAMSKSKHLPPSKAAKVHQAALNDDEVEEALIQQLADFAVELATEDDNSPALPGKQRDLRRMIAKNLRAQQDDVLYEALERARDQEAEAYPFLRQAIEEA
eukprot:gene39536-48197_t